MGTGGNRLPTAGGADAPKEGLEPGGETRFADGRSFDSAAHRIDAADADEVTSDREHAAHGLTIADGRRCCPMEATPEYYGAMRTRYGRRTFTVFLVWTAPPASSD